MYKSASRSQQKVIRRTTKQDHLYRRKSKLAKRLDEAAKARAAAERAAYEADHKPRFVRASRSSN